MISICTVLNGFSKDYYKHFLQSLKRNCKHKKRWLSFGTKDGHLYTTDLIYNNFDAEISLPSQELIFHEGSSSFKPIAESKLQKSLLVGEGPYSSGTPK
jgi:hypothetical protein